MIVSCLGAQLRWLNQLGHFTPLSPTMAGNQSNSNNTTFHGVLMDIFKCMNRQEKSTESSKRNSFRSESAGSKVNRTIKVSYCSVSLSIFCIELSGGQLKMYRLLWRTKVRK